MKKRLTALVISVIMLGVSLCSCSGDAVDMHTYNATLEGETFYVSYLAEKGEGEPMSEEELEAVDKAISDALEKSLFIFSEENSAGVGEINKQVDAVLQCNKDLLELISYTYSLNTLTNGKYQPVFGAVTELYKDKAEVTPEALEEALKHTGTELVTIEGKNIRKSDRAAKLDYDSISAGYALRDAMAVLSANNVKYGVLTFKNTVATFGSLSKDDTVDIAVYLSGGGETHSGILSVKDAVVTTCNKDSFVLDSKTGERAVSEYDTVIVVCNDGILSNVLADVIYSMSTEEVQKMYDSKLLSFEAVMIKENGEFYKTSDNIRYIKSE